ncbi:MAG: cytochrome C assembly family protein [Gammaproteobacteria bacterium]
MACKLHFFTYYGGMDPTLLLLFTLLGYGLAFIFQLMSLNRPFTTLPMGFFLGGILACVAQGWLLYYWIDGPKGQNLTYLNFFAMVTWLNSVLTFIMGIYRPLQSLSILSFPLAIGAMVLAWIFPGHYVIQTACNPWELAHILLAVLAVSLLCLAAIQAILLLVQQRLLRRGMGSAFIQRLPSLETNEQWLFAFVAIGFFLLGTVLVLSLATFSNLTESTSWLRAATAILSWLIFAVLLFGRFFFGWRGRVAIRWTLVGSGLLLLSYCVSHWLP